ncbi:MAG TPA: hypothetical protein VMW76_00945 [Bacteroidales bacterium]|nr:hypothetical protein [Bacteroidales bacterium]
MTFDNGKTIIRLRLRVFIVSVLFIIYLYFTYYGKSLKFPILGFGDLAWTFALIFIYFAISFYPLIFRYKYIYFSDIGPRIILRYYSVGLFRGKRNSVEIPKKDFAGYRMERSCLGLVGSLILQQRIDRRVAQYPPVYITSLSRKEIKKMIVVLDQYTQQI